jgi:hypothetical protein
LGKGEGVVVGGVHAAAGGGGFHET